MILNAFSVLTASQNGNGLWRHADDQRHRFNEMEWWIDYARLVEEAGFTSLMFADSFGTGDVTDALDRAQMEEGAYFPASDPFVYVPALAAATRRLSFIVTASTTFENPYALARRFASLDHLAHGRVGWNIVTSFVPAMGRAYGTPLPPHAERYARANEFLHACYLLWEGSWQDDAQVIDGDRLVDPDRIHDVQHTGRFLSLSGRFTVAPSPQRTPVLVQAGHSAQGTAFAAENAEVVLVTGSKRVAAAHVREVTGRASERGRDARNLRFFVPVVIVTGRDDSDANERAEEYRRLWSRRASAAVMALFTGQDLTAGLDSDSPFVYAPTDRHQSAARGLAGSGKANKSPREAYEDATEFPGSHVFIVGGPEAVADELESWMAETGVHGFNLMDLVTPADTARFIEYVIPELRRRGLVEAPVQGSTLRETLFGSGARLAADHPGMRVHRPSNPQSL